MTDSSLNQFVTRGTAAARAAFTPTPPVSSSGYFWFETDTSDTYSWSGSAWVKVNTGGGGGAMTLITETVTSGAATNVSFASITGTYRDLHVRVRGRGTKSATLCVVQMRFNGDTGANYDQNDIEVNSSYLTPGQIVAATKIAIGYLAAATAPPNVADSICTDVFDYRGTTFQKSTSGQSTVKAANSGGNLYVVVSSGWWRSTAAITQIDVFPDTGAFVDGTVVSLYGLM